MLVKITYYKSNGTYYTDHDWEFEGNLESARLILTAMVNAGVRPGLVSCDINSNEYVVVTDYFLILPSNLREHSE